jgi:hypothetical protein
MTQHAPVNQKQSLRLCYAPILVHGSSQCPLAIDVHGPRAANISQPSRVVSPTFTSRSSPIQRSHTLFGTQRAVVLARIENSLRMADSPTRTKYIDTSK